MICCVSSYKTSSFSFFNLNHSFHRVDKSTLKYVRLRGDPLALKGDFDGVVTRTRLERRQWRCGFCDRSVKRNIVGPLLGRPVVTRNQERVRPKPVLGGLVRAHL